MSELVVREGEHVAGLDWDGPPIGMVVVGIGIASWAFFLLQISAEPRAGGDGSALYQGLEAGSGLFVLACVSEGDGVYHESTARWTPRGAAF